jgi:hypothetical protein
MAALCRNMRKTSEISPDHVHDNGHTPARRPLLLTSSINPIVSRNTLPHRDNPGAQPSYATPCPLAFAPLRRSADISTHCGPPRCAIRPILASYWCQPCCAARKSGQIYAVEDIAGPFGVRTSVREGIAVIEMVWRRITIVLLLFISFPSRPQYIN